MTFEVTDKAYAKLAELMTDKGVFLRVSVRQGGCSGMTYDAGFDDYMEHHDEVVFEREHVRVVASTYDDAFLDGLIIDYSDDLISAGFRLTNPANADSCGCGQSFKPCTTGECNVH